MYIGSHHNYRAKNSNARDIIPQRKFGLEVLKQKLPTIVKNSKIIVFSYASIPSGQRHRYRSGQVQQGRTYASMTHGSLSYFASS